MIVIQDPYVSGCWHYLGLLFHIRSISQTSFTYCWLKVYFYRTHKKLYIKYCVCFIAVCWTQVVCKSLYILYNMHHKITDITFWTRATERHNTRNACECTLKKDVEYKSVTTKKQIHIKIVQSIEFQKE